MSSIPYKRSKDSTVKFPAISLTRRDPSLAAVASKAETSRGGYFASGGLGGGGTVSNTHLVRQILSKRAKRNSDAAAVPKILPDVELAIQILVASIMSPQDMASVEFIYSPPSDVLSSELTAGVMARIKRHFDETYIFKNKMPSLLREALFEKGAYAVAVIPENAIDQLINGNRAVSTESLNEFINADGTARQLGILGKPGAAKQTATRLGLSLESLTGGKRFEPVTSADTRITYVDTALMPDNSDLISDYTEAKPGREEFLIITDNPSTLKLPRLNEVAREKRIREIFTSGQAGYAEESLMVDRSKITNAVFRNRPHSSEPVGSIPTQNETERKSIGEPLVMKLPSESVLPVHVPGNPSQHIAYLILIDEEGNPIEAPDGDQLYSNLRQTRNSTLSSNLIRKASLNLGIDNDQFDPSNNLHARFASSLYAEMVERDIVSRIQNGVHAKTVAIANNEEAYRLMLSRVLAKRYTQLLYIPVEYMTYFAFKYSDDGIGRSLLDDQSVLFTLRATLLFSDILGAVKNSIGRTKVQVDIDPSDNDPMKSLEMVQDEYIRTRTLSLPFAMSDPSDYTTFLQRAAVEWEFNHPKLPVSKVDIQQLSSSYQRPDSDLQENLRKTSIMGLGLQPETVDNAANPDFATSIVQGNVLLQKRVIAWQDQLNPMITDHLRKYATSSRPLIDDIKKLLLASYDDIRIELDPDELAGVKLSDEEKKRIIVSRALQLFLGGFSVELPRPSSVTLEGQMEDFKKYEEALDAALDAYFSADVFTENVSGDFGGDQVNTLKAMYKAYYLRRYLSEKGVLSEVTELTTEGEDGLGIDRIGADVIRHIQRVASSGIKTFATLKATSNAINADLKATGVSLPENTTTTDDTSSSGSSGGDDVFGGGDDFGMGGGDDFGGGGGDVDDEGGDVDANTPSPTDDAQAGSGADGETK